MCCACSKDKQLSLTSVFPRLRPFPFIKPGKPSAEFPGNCTMVSYIASRDQTCSMHGVRDANAWGVCLACRGRRAPQVCWLHCKAVRMARSYCTP